MTLQFGGLDEHRNVLARTARSSPPRTSTTPVDTGSSPSVTLTNGNPFAALVVNTTAGNAMSLHAGSTDDRRHDHARHGAPVQIAFGADGTKAYVVDSSANTITAITTWRPAQPGRPSR